MDARRRRALVLSTVGALALLVGLFAVVGARRVLESLVTAEPSLVGVTFAFGLCWLTAWSLVLRTVLTSMGVNLPVGKSFLVYAGATFANNVTPFGQAGGEPIAALLISKVSEARFETGLAGIASVDIANVLTSVSLVLLAASYHASITVVGERVRTAIGSALGLVAVVGLLVLLARRFRRPITDLLAASIAPRVAHLRPGSVEAAGIEENVRDRLGRFAENAGSLASDRRGLAVVLGLSGLGWLLQAGALLAAFAALGYGVPPHVAVLVIPLGNLAGAAPLPGGLGGIEAAFVALLVPTTGVAPAAVTAAVLIYRGAIYWTPMLIGGASVAAFGVRATV